MLDIDKIIKGIRPTEINEDNNISNIKKLELIYENQDFHISTFDNYPYRMKLHNYDISRRYKPKVILGFGKYSNKTLYQVYKIDKPYFNWLFQENILCFGYMKTSPKIKYTTENTY